MVSPKKVAVLGFDCALTPLVDKHIEEGILPNFAKVFKNGVVCDNCLVPYPTITPPNWTSIATGAWPGTHQVTDFWRHEPGTTPDGAHTHSNFNWDNVEAESIWEAAEKAGKKCVVMNYPTSYNVHKKLKNSVVVGGAALTPGVFMDEDLAAKIMGVERKPGTSFKYSFCSQTMVSTEPYPMGVKVELVDAEGWTNVDDLGDDPLEFSFRHPFTDTVFDPEPTTWHVLVRDPGEGYEDLTLSPSKDFSQAFCTVKNGAWSKAANAVIQLKDGSSKEIRFMVKAIKIEGDASEVTFYVTHALPTDGTYWCHPNQAAARLNKGDNVATNNAGYFNLALGWIDEKTWLEIVSIHYDWLGDTAEALLGEGDWDVFFMHSHPTDYIYHHLMTDLDPNTCASPERYEEAWDIHRELYRRADRYLGRLLDLMDDDTLVILISDHGATPDGPGVNTYRVLNEAGLSYKHKVEDAEWLQSLPANVRGAFRALQETVDTSRSKAIASRACYVNINLKGRDPEGIVEPEDYETVQREIIDAMMTYVHPKTGKRPFALALPKKEAMMMGLWGDQVGDVVYAFWPEYSGQHGNILPTSDYGLSTLKTLCVYYGPKVNVKEGLRLQRVCNIVDVVPTICYMTGWPLPEHAEGAVVYQMMKDPNQRG
ncbi:MAG: alkaline phosphatase family protein [Desulfobacteraceae bacterium]|nr:alkaline phosphatase family protein [Desulfobacteraceae bacterium]